jgi:cysteine desulfurase / selenocysteine lyase
MNTANDKAQASLRASFDADKLRRHFPIFEHPVNGKPLIFLDNAATTQKPRSVIDAITHFYTQECASIRRSAYFLGDRATELYENSRNKIRRFLNAASAREIIFVRGSTEAINLVAQTYGRHNFRPGDEIVISAMEHHSNIVPWQLLCNEIGAHLRISPIDSKGELLLDQYADILSSKTRLVAATYISNALGTINPVHEIIKLAHNRNIPVLIDGAQAVPHVPIDVQTLDCDFFVFSGHKMYGPTGIGILYGKENLLDLMPPYQGGGDMIRSVTFEKTSYSELPYKFEAGTPHVAGAIGLGYAIDFLESIGMQSIFLHEHELLTYATDALRTVKGLHIIGEANKKAALISFVMDGIHPHDIGTILDEDGIAVRSGHHCAQPVMDFFNIPATVRASVGLYNTRDDIDALLGGLSRVREVFH